VLSNRRVWQMSDAMEKNALVVKEELKMARERVWKLIEGRVSADEPIRYRSFIGENAMDLIGTGFVGRYLLSDRIFAIFEKASLTGWASYPVEITGRNGETIRGYRGIAVTSAIPRVQLARMDIEVVPDLFFIENTRRICFIQRAYDALLNLQPSNLRFTQIDVVSASADQGVKLRHDNVAPVDSSPFKQDSAGPSEDELIRRLIAFVSAQRGCGAGHGELRRAQRAIDKTLSATALANEERRLGFSLPSVLRRAYSEIGNGGFGPGIIWPLEITVNQYLAAAKNMYPQPRAGPYGRVLAEPGYAAILLIGFADPEGQWAVDAAHESGRVFRFFDEPIKRKEAGLRTASDSHLLPVAKSLSAWLWEWLQKSAS